MWQMVLDIVQDVVLLFVLAVTLRLLWKWRGPTPSMPHRSVPDVTRKPHAVG